MRVDKQQGIRNLCEVAAQILQTMEVNAATKFAVRTVIREAINKSCPGYKGNSNRRNVRYISNAARELIDETDAQLIADHAVPVSLALTEIDKIKRPSADQLVVLVAKFSTMVLITKEEDKLLRDEGLVKSMPEGWAGDDPLARYKKVNIKLNEIKPALT